MIQSERVAGWLAAALDARWSSVDVTRMAGGHSSGAWRVTSADGGAALVLKAPEEPSVVFRRDAAREGRILEAVGAMGAPVPAVVAVDDRGHALGRPCFVMEHVDGRSPADASPASYHDDPWLRAAGADVQRAVWNSFHDALAALHAVDPAKVPDASHGPNGVIDVLAYWRAALLDVARGASVPRQLAVLDWLGDNLPAGADERPAVCMGDARLVNCLVVGTDVRALVDFEVAYVGNPAADVGYSLFVDARHRGNTEQPLPGIPVADDTWARWCHATGHTVDDREYWTAFGATIIVVTATRAMIQWGFADPATVESANPLVGAWEAAVAAA